MLTGNSSFTAKLFIQMSEKYTWNSTTLYPMTTQRNISMYLVTKSEGFLFNCYVKYVIVVNLAVIQALKHVKQEK